MADEGQHLEFAVALYHHLQLQTKTDLVQKIIRSAVAIEKKFITEAIPCKMIGMDSEKMSQYIEYVADRLLKQLGHAPLWNAENPFDWMENISLEGKTNFFEKRVGDYSKHVDNDGIRFDEDF